jgi:cytochrome c553
MCPETYHCCDCGSCHGEEGHEPRPARRFLTKAEKAEMLKNYAEQLRKEVAAVEEHIKELEG